MGDLTTVDEILDFAIQNEQGAVDMYTELASKAKSASMKAAFEQFAGEERGGTLASEHVAVTLGVMNQRKRMSVSAEVVGDFVNASEAHYCLCGPTRFMAAVQDGLEARGVCPERIHTESFGPAG